jgi:hypothetical protein
MKRRLAAATGALAMLGALALAARFLVGESSADLENPGRDTEPRVFTSQRDRIRMVVPRLWRATDQPSYPGLILWMTRSQPPAQIVLTSEAFTRDLYCTWPVACRAGGDSLTARFACALRAKLAAQRLRVGPTQPGPKENEQAGIPSVWFEYEDGKRFLRHAVALTADRAYSLVLSSPTNEARASHARAFDQILRSLRPISAAEAAPGGAGSAGSSAGAVSTGARAPASTPLADGGAPATDATDPPARSADAAAPPADAAAPPPDGAPGDASVAFESAPAPKIDPVGPCPERAP